MEDVLELSYTQKLTAVILVPTLVMIMQHVTISVPTNLTVYVMWGLLEMECTVNVSTALANCSVLYDLY